MNNEESASSTRSECRADKEILQISPELEVQDEELQKQQWGINYVVLRWNEGRN